jgi:hypothetical protein
MSPFERLHPMRVGGFLARQVGRLDAVEFQIALGSVEVAVARHDQARPVREEHGEQDPFGGPPLVGRHDVAKAEDVGNGCREPVPAPRPGVGLITHEYGAPLMV